MYDLLTVVTELVANAVRHGSGKRIGIAVDVTERQVRGEVQNKGTGDVTPRPVKLGRAGGLGLHIVAAIARRWDAQTNGVTRVSFELRRA
jgi:anti-sigma regulatory factor (Ser/Thr protein kinase)